MARALEVSTDGRIPNRLINSRNKLIKLAKGLTIAVMESLPDELLPETICAVGDKSEVTDEKKKQLWQMTESKLTDEERQQMYYVLVEYADLFAEWPDDFGRTSNIKHTINTGDAQPL